MDAQPRPSLDGTKENGIMRLLNTGTLQFRDFSNDTRPEYAIVSHRWGDDEVSHKDFYKNRKTDGPGYRKIVEFCDFVRRCPIPSALQSTSEGKGLEWAWIDTCCIDQRSSAELSESINSMFRWYKNASVCVVYLVDVQTADGKIINLEDSVWCECGWTLQELLALERIVFCDAKSLQYMSIEKTLPTRSLLDAKISKITGIESKYFPGFDPKATLASVARRMHWASGRKTTRLEDEAYALLGIFDVNMPLISGEGSKAFIRLQKEIIRHTTDQSIFAWKLVSYSSRDGFGLFANSPANFAKSKGIVGAWNNLTLDRPFTVTNNGIEFIAEVYVDDDKPYELSGMGTGVRILKLNCSIPHQQREEKTPVRVRLARVPGTKNHFVRILLHNLGDYDDTRPPIFIRADYWSHEVSLHVQYGHDQEEDIWGRTSSNWD